MPSRRSAPWASPRSCRCRGWRRRWPPFGGARGHRSSIAWSSRGASSAAVDSQPPAGRCFRLARMECQMNYTLEGFIKDARSALEDNEGPAGREKVRVLLERLLTNRSFVDEVVGPSAPIGTRKLYEDKDLGFVVLA